MWAIWRYIVRSRHTIFYAYGHCLWSPKSICASALFASFWTHIYVFFRPCGCVCQRLNSLFYNAPLFFFLLIMITKLEQAASILSTPRCISHSNAAFSAQSSGKKKGTHCVDNHFGICLEPAKLERISTILKRKGMSSQSLKTFVNIFDYSKYSSCQYTVLCYLLFVTWNESKSLPSCWMRACNPSWNWQSKIVECLL